MRIAQVVCSIEARHGGPSVSVPGLSAAIARLGHEVQLLSTGDETHRPSDQVKSLELRIFPRREIGRLCISPKLGRYLHTSQFDAIHSHGLWLRPLHYAHRRCAALNIPHVLSPRGMMSKWAWRHHAWRKCFARRFVHPGAFEAVCGWHATSEEEAIEIRSLGFRQPVCIAPNGVEIPSASERELAVDHWRAACPEIENRPVALFYSRFHQKKRVLQLIDTWVEKAPKEWLLLLVGIPDEYTPHGLEHYAERLSAKSRIRAFSGLGRPAPYAVASLFVLPSHSENFGLVIAEAMSHGVPPLVTDTTPWREVSRLEMGWCVQWEQFGKALEEATTDRPERLRARGALAQTWVLKNYSWDRSAKLLADFYASLKAGNTR